MEKNGDNGKKKWNKWKKWEKWDLMGKNLEVNFEKMNSSEQNLPRIYYHICFPFFPFSIFSPIFPFLKKRRSIIFHFIIPLSIFHYPNDSIFHFFPLMDAYPCAWPSIWLTRRELTLGWPLMKPPAVSFLHFFGTNLARLHWRFLRICRFGMVWNWLYQVWAGLEFVSAGLGRYGTSFKICSYFFLGRNFLSKKGLFLAYFVSSKVIIWEAARQVIKRQERWHENKL